MVLVECEFYHQIRDRLPHLKAIVQYRGEPSKDYPDTYTV